MTETATGSADVEAMLRRHVVVPDRREVWEWAADAIDFGRTTAFSGKYDIDNVPWQKEILRAYNDPRVREVTVIMPPQDSGKTKGAETYLAFRICTSPTNAAYNMPTNVKAETWSETRWEPMLNSVAGIKERFAGNENLKKKRRIVFKDSTFLLIQGAETKANRAGDSVEVQINDECNLWERPQMREMHGRTDAYRETRKIINISVGGRKGSELHERYVAGDQRELCHHCEKCGELFEYVFDHRNPRCNIRFDVSKAILHADGRLDLRDFEKTIFVECQNPNCREKMTYNRERLARLNRRGVYVPKNPDADPSVVSFHANAFALGREPWKEILEPWVRMFVKGGVFLAASLEEFVTKKLAEFWDEKPFAVTTEIKLSGWTRFEVSQRKWVEEAFRIMTIDNQRGRQGDIPHRWFTAAAFSTKGAMRVFDAGRINEWPDVKRRQVELGIPDPTEATPGPYVLCDRRWDPVTVDERTATYKWYGSLGAAQDEFVHPPWSPFAGTRQIFSEPRMIDIGFGSADTGRTFATYFLWSSQKMQDLLAELRNAGLIEFARDSGDWAPELGLQMNSHKQFMEMDRVGAEKRVWKRIGDTPDHLYDCVTQAVVVGCMAGIYKKE
jgi:hypothetical protein